MDRNNGRLRTIHNTEVALRKESVDRNRISRYLVGVYPVALRKESVDRNGMLLPMYPLNFGVALRKESVDRNSIKLANLTVCTTSLSARRAWIEIRIRKQIKNALRRRSPQGERG